MGLINILKNDVLKETEFIKDDNSLETQLEHLKVFRSKLNDEGKEIIDRDIKLLEYGIRGEDNICYELKSSYIPMYVIHDLYLTYNDLSAQIDYLLITDKKIYIVECKNLYGNIEIDSNANFVRTITVNGKKTKKGIYSPIEQNNKHLRLIEGIYKEKTNMLSSLLGKDGFSDRFETIVVLANPDTYLNNRYAKKDVKAKVIRADNLIEYINNKNKQSKNSEWSKTRMLEEVNFFLDKNKDNLNDYTKKYENYLIGNNGNLKQEKPINVDNQKLINELKSFRKNAAYKENVPAYYIFNNATLDSIVEHKPRTLKELYNVQGFGKVKVEKYGNDILKIINGI